MENNIPKFTFCITSKNNLRYLKHAVHYIKQNSAVEHDILVFIDADNDGTEKWCNENNIKYIKNSSAELFGIGNAYNLLVEKSETDFVVIYHADMIMGKGFDTALYKNWKPKTVISATRIEPPLHPADPAKIVLDLGLWPETDIKDGFKIDEFNTFVEQNKKDLITNGIFAPWLIHKDDFNNVGGHDPIMKSHSEDRDLFNRFLLNGYKLIQSWEALVYHLTCRGGQFEHANETKDFQVKSEAWQYKNQVSLLEYIRKWGGMFKEYGPCEPRPNRKYNIGIQIKNCDLSILNTEPYFDNMSVDCDYKPYVDHMQPLSKFDLTSKFTKTLNNDIVVEFDLQLGNTEELNYIIANIEDIMDQITETGSYEFGTVKLNINNIQVCNPKIKLI